MNDDDFLGYVEIHSRTELALFHRSMVERLIELAGESPSEWLIHIPRSANGFLGVHSDVADPLVKKARTRMDLDDARYMLIAGFIPDDEEMREVAIRMKPSQLAEHAYEVNRAFGLECAGLRADLRAALEALQWCSGAQDFQAGGLAESGYEKVVRPLLQRLQGRSESFVGSAQ